MVSARTTMQETLRKRDMQHTVARQWRRSDHCFEDGAGDCRLQPGTNIMLVDALGEALNELQYDGNVCPTLEVALGAGGYDIRLDAPASAIMSSILLSCSWSVSWRLVPCSRVR